MGTEKGQFMFYCSFSFYIEFGRGDSFWLEYSNSGRGVQGGGKNLSGNRQIGWFWRQQQIRCGFSGRKDGEILTLPCFSR